MARPTQDELLLELGHTWHPAQPFLGITTKQIQLGDPSAVPEEVREKGHLQCLRRWRVRTLAKEAVRRGIAYPLGGRY